MRNSPEPSVGFHPERPQGCTPDKSGEGQSAACDKCGPHVEAKWRLYKLIPPTLNRQTRTVELHDRMELALCGHHAHAREYGSKMVQDGWVPVPIDDRNETLLSAPSAEPLLQYKSDQPWR